MLLNKHRFALLVALATVSLPIAAQAQRKSPLADAPAIRKRFELRQTRFEIGAGAGTTVNQDFFHTVLINVRLAFHITDWLSIAGFGDFGVAQIATGFQDKLNGSLATMGNPNCMNVADCSVLREPTLDQSKASLQQISNILGAQLEFTPFTGKFSLFGKLFAAYDFYAFVGGAGITVKTAGNVGRTCDTPAPTSMPGNANSLAYSCEVSGLKPGPTFGVGLHTFFGQFVALDVELRDVMAQLNPSGRDVNGDGVADKNDLSWTHTYVIGGNLVLYLPTTAKISP